MIANCWICSVGYGATNGKVVCDRAAHATFGGNV